MPPVSDSSDDSAPPATIKMPDLSQRQTAESEELTASLRAAGVLQGDEKATLIFNERGDVTGLFLDAMSAQHAESLARYMTALKVHDHEKPAKRGSIETATIDDLSPIDWLDRQRQQRDKESKPKSPSGSSSRSK